MRITLTTRNVRATIARIHAADASAQRVIRETVRWGGEETERIVRATVPYDQGFMHDHVRTEYSNDGLRYETGWFAEDFAGAGLPFYPPFVEFGTSRAPAQPSLFPAREEVVPKFQQRLRQRLRAAIRRQRVAAGRTSDA